MGEARADAPKMSPIDAELLRILECPVGHVPVLQVGDWLYSTDPETRRKYPIRDDIPVMLIEDSEVADPEEFERVMAQVKQPQDIREQNSDSE